MGTPSTTKHTFLDAKAQISTLALYGSRFGYGDVYFVDKAGGVDTNNGLGDWSNAFKTITAAVAAAGDYDTILVGPGFYTEAAVITITQIGLKIIGLNSSGKTRGPCAMKTPTAAGAMLSLTSNTGSTGANDCEIANLAFIATSGQKAIQLGTAAEGYLWRTHIHNCAFFGDDTGTYAVAVYGATTTPSAGAFPDVAECVVEDCYFYSWATAATCVYGTRVSVKNNVIFLTGAGDIGIVIGTGRPMGECTGNKILGANNTGDIGIKITGDAATHIIDRNTILNTHGVAI